MNPDTTPPALPTPGADAPDGSIVGAVRQDGSAIYIAAIREDADYTRAEKDAGKLNVHGHQDWRVPSLNDWQVLLPNIQSGALASVFNPASEKTAYRASDLVTTHSAWCFDVNKGERQSDFKCVDRPTIFVRG